MVISEEPVSVHVGLPKRKVMNGVKSAAAVTRTRLPKSLLPSGQVTSTRTFAGFIAKSWRRTATAMGLLLSLATLPVWAAWPG